MPSTSKRHARGLFLLPIVLAFLGWLPARPSAVTPVALPARDQLLASLKTGHPRLLLAPGGFPALKARITGDTLLSAWYAKIKASAKSVLTQTPSIYEIPDGLRLLATSRRVMERTYMLALAYRMEGDTLYRDRLWAELSAAAAFPDWNAQRHFLDVGEMSHAFAIGYDWMYDAWTPAQRAILLKAMDAYGFKPALAAYKSASGWPKVRNNWNFVCNGGMGMAALALAGEDTTALDVLDNALQSLRDAGAMEEFAPDGGWGEGPGYWTYGTTYLVTFLAGLESSLGTSFGFTKFPGLSETGSFPINATAPSGRFDNFADAGEGTVRAPCLYWLAKTFSKPAYARYQTQYAAPHTTDLIWYIADTDKSSGNAAADLPVDAYYRHVEFASFRSRWNDPQAAFAGFKAGDNKFNHSHLDLGSFVADALGVRWAGDMGSDDYNMPGYFDGSGPRWTYYRLRAEGNNTLDIDPGAGPDQDPKAAAAIINHQSGATQGFAVADLTPAYAAKAQKVLRGFALIHNREWFLVQDEVQAAKPVEAWWFMHTKAALQVEKDSLTATFTQDGKRLLARILAPATARFTVMDAKPLPGSPNPAMQNANAGWKKLAVHLSGVTDLRLSIVLVPLGPNDVAPTAWPTVYPLEKGWPSGTTSIRGLGGPSGKAADGSRPWAIENGCIAFKVPPEARFQAVLTRPDGRVALRFQGNGQVTGPAMLPGLYHLRLKLESGAVFGGLVVVP